MPCKKKIKNAIINPIWIMFVFVFGFAERQPGDPARTVLPSVHLKPMHSCWKRVQGTQINNNITGLESRSEPWREAHWSIFFQDGDSLKENEALKQHIRCRGFSSRTLSFHSVPVFSCCFLFPHVPLLSFWCDSSGFYNVHIVIGKQYKTSVGRTN